jgi:hypothetical protein
MAWAVTCLFLRPGGAGTLAASAGPAAGPRQSGLMSVSVMAGGADHASTRTGPYQLTQTRKDSRAGKHEMPPQHHCAPSPASPQPDAAERPVSRTWQSARGRRRGRLRNQARRIGDLQLTRSAVSRNSGRSL